MTDTELAKLAELVPPPVGTISSNGLWVLYCTSQGWVDRAEKWRWRTVELYQGPATTASSQIGGGCAQPDPASPAWRAAQLDWLLKHGSLILHSLPTQPGIEAILDLDVSRSERKYGPDAFARLVLAVAERERA